MDRVTDTTRSCHSAGGKHMTLNLTVSMFNFKYLHEERLLSLRSIPICELAKHLFKVIHEKPSPSCYSLFGYVRRNNLLPILASNADKLAYIFANREKINTFSKVYSAG